MSVRENARLAIRAVLALEELAEGRTPANVHDQLERDLLRQSADNWKMCAGRAEEELRKARALLELLKVEHQTATQAGAAVLARAGEAFERIRRVGEMGRNGLLVEASGIGRIVLEGVLAAVTDEERELKKAASSAFEAVYRAQASAPTKGR